MTISLMQIIAWCASIPVFFAFFMKTMIPLRIVAISSNCIFILYGVLGILQGISEVLPIMVLHLSLLPLNCIRLKQARQLIKRVETASSQEKLSNELIPYMTLKKYKEGTTLFHKGDRADRFYYIKKGSVIITELNKTLGENKVFGEVGIFGPGSVRSAGVVCLENSEIYNISKRKMLQLYFQNPKFGFFIVRLLSNYALDNVNKLHYPDVEDETE